MDVRDRQAERLEEQFCGDAVIAFRIRRRHAPLVSPEKMDVRERLPAFLSEPGYSVKKVFRDASA
jgi:hypothetical protein